MDDRPQNVLVLLRVQGFDEVRHRPRVIDVPKQICRRPSSNKLLVVVEPGRRSIDTAEHIRFLAAEIGLKNIAVIGNKIRRQKDEEFLKHHLAGFDYLGSLPYDDALIEADLEGISPYDTASLTKEAVKEMVAWL